MLKKRTRMPAICDVGFDREAIERFDQPEHAGQHAGLGKILFDFLV